ncbi:MAG: S28 family serine protease [Tannerellaceae bacterium]
MNRLFRLVLLLALASVYPSVYASTQLTASEQVAQSDLVSKLEKENRFSDIKKLESDHYAEKYVCFIDQPLDHANQNSDRFKQRFVVMHVGFDKPTVLVTEGYGGAYAMNPRYREELSKLFDANVVFVEHRYFLESTPQPLDWSYLTAENSAYDLHNVTTAMKKIYPGKWMSTGVSKGGQTTIIYRTFFPEDVDISVPYVALVCRDVEDGRHEPFLRKVGTKKDRQIIEDYQLEVLKRREEIQPMFDAYCKEKGLQFNLGQEEVLDYTVLEYSFSIWQWGTPTSTIPTKDASTKEIYDHLMKICAPDYFAKGQSTESFFVQASKELGYYGYDIKPFKKYLKVKDTKGYLNAIMLPDGLTTTFDRTLHNKINSFLKANDPKMIFVYGQNDPWTAAGITSLKNKENVFIAVEPNGSHLARIGTLPEEIKQEVMQRITKWLNE